MTYDEFVEMYCDGVTPTPLQKHAIESWLEHPKGTVLWLSGRGGGKSTCLDWLRKAWQDEGTKWREMSPNLSLGYLQEFPLEALFADPANPSEIRTIISP